MIAKQKYNPDWDNQAYRLALLGMTDVEMAQYFGIGRATLARYKKQFPSFNEAMLNGKVEADAEVAKSLYKRAVGCTVTETKTKVVVDEDGNEQVTEVVKTETELPPDVTACTRWLVNRRPKNWRQKVDVPLEVNITPIDWEALREITKQAVEQAERQHQEVISSRYERLGLSRDYQGD